jgi:hypothetical protein
MPSRRATALSIAVVVLLGVGALLVTGAGKHTHLVQTTAVNPVYPVAPLRAGATVCQAPLGTAEPFDRVQFNAGTLGRPGPPLAVSVTDQSTGAEIGWGRQQPGWVDNGVPREIHVGTIEGGPRIGVCVRNLGRTTAYLYGDYYHGKGVKGPLGVTPTNSTVVAAVDGVIIEGDLAMSFYSAKEHSALSWIPAIFRHAAAFKPPFVGAWTFWLLALLALIGAPLALWAALTAGSEASRPSDDPEPPDPSLPSVRP